MNHVYIVTLQARHIPNGTTWAMCVHPQHNINSPALVATKAVPARSKQPQSKVTILVILTQKILSVEWLIVVVGNQPAFIYVRLEVAT